MTNFEEMAKAAKAKSQAIIDEAANKKKAELEAENSRLQTAEEALIKTVLPVLEEAARAFALDGIELKIAQAKSFRLTNGSTGATTPVRTISFHCTAEENHEFFGNRQVSGNQFEFEHDGSTLIWKAFTTNGYGQPFKGGAIEPYVSPVIGRALESYYEKLRVAR